MSYNGSGTFVINSAGQPVVTGTVISSTAFNALTADLATGLSTAITKDGQTTTTSRILFAQGISSTLTTDATSTTTGSIITAGGISCQKAAVVGTLLGVGMAPVNVLDITQTQDTASNISLRNSSTGTSASSRVYLGNSVSATSGRLITWGSGFTSTGVYRQDGLLLEGVGAGGVTISANAVQPIYFGINNVEKMRLDTSGRLGIGMTPTAGYGALQAYTGAGGTQIGIGLAATVGLLNYFGNDFQISSNATLSSGGSWTARYTAAALMELRGDGSIVFQSNTGLTAGNSFSPTERARFGTSGGLSIGTSTQNAKLSIDGSISSQGIYVNSSASGDDAIYAQNASGLTGSALTCNVGGTPTYLIVFKFQGSAVGTITTNGTTTAYNTSSDYRLKENVQLMTGGLDTIAALKPVTYDWISNGSAGEGFIAHELQAVIPEAVYGEKDAVNDKGEIKPQGVDFSKIVPHLVAAIQELTTRLAALENK